MNGTLRILPIATALLAALLQVGCGGSRTQTAASSLRFTVKWPARTARLIPIDCQSIVAVVDNASGTQVATETIPRPQSGSSTTVTFTGLTAGNDTLIATAYPTATGTGVAQATGSAPATIDAGQTAQVTVTMADTIVRVVVTPANPTVLVGNTTALTMTAYDSANEVVLTSPTTTRWVSGNTAAATISSSGVVTGVTNGTSLITATETESNVSGSTTATVNYFEPINVVLDQSGKYAYSLDNSGDLYEFSVGANGQLTPLSPSVTVTGYLASGYNSGPSGYNAYVATNNTLYVVEHAEASDEDEVIAQFSIQANGQLQPLSPAVITLPTGSRGYNLFTDPTQKYLYVELIDGSNNNTVQIYQIGSNGLTLTTTQNLGGTAPLIAMPIPGTSYVVGNPGGYIVTYQVQSNGTLTPVATNANYSLVPVEYVSPTGKFVYMFVKQDGLLDAFAVNSDGSLTDDGAAYAGSDSWTESTFVENSTGTLMVVRSPGSISSYTVNADGTLTLVTSISRPSQSNSDDPIAITPDNKYVYDPESPDLAEFSLSSTGVLTLLATTK